MLHMRWSPYWWHVAKQPATAQQCIDTRYGSRMNTLWDKARKEYALVSRGPQMSMHHTSQQMTHIALKKNTKNKQIHFDHTILLLSGGGCTTGSCQPITLYYTSFTWVSILTLHVCILKYPYIPLIYMYLSPYMISLAVQCTWKVYSAHQQCRTRTVVLVVLHVCELHACTMWRHMYLKYMQKHPDNMILYSWK